MSNSKSKKKKSLFKIILISFFSLATLLILFFSILFILFLVYKDNISKTFLSSVNQKIDGKITFSDLSFTPFKHFPSASLKFYDLALQESKDSVLNSSKQPVFGIKEVYVSVNIVDLFSSHINASTITIEGGMLNFVVYPDSQTNLEKAIKRKSKKEIVIQEEPAETEAELNLQIDNLEIIDLELSAENHLKKNKVQLQINELQSNFSYTKNQVISSVNLDAKIDSLIKNNAPLLSDMQVKIESMLEVDTDSIYVKLEEGSFSIGEAKFNFKGIFDSKKQGYIDLSFVVSDKDFSVFSLFLRDDELKNIKAGDLYFDGSLKGKTFVEFPIAEFSFGLKNVELINPITKREIKNLNLQGQFNSGKAEDWSDARLAVDTLFANLPDGLVKLSGSVHNFKMPEVDISIFLSADVTGLEEVFKLGSISDLRGKIELTDRIKGKYLIEEKKFVSENTIGRLSLDNFGVKIPGTMVFDNVNGVIRRENDDIYFDSLAVISEDTDILINGEVQNLPYLFFNVEKDIEANLDIKSSVFDLPNFLAFDPSIKRDFNHRILDVDVSVKAKTTTSKATKFKSFPEIEFDIKKIHATAENFLPRLKINSGKFKVSENLLGFNLKFDNFKTDFLDGDFNFTGEYNSSKYQPFYIKAKTDFKTISPSILFYDESDTIPEFLTGKLSGSFFVELQFPVDSTILKFVNLKNGDLSYKFKQDTIIIHSLNFNLNDLYFNEKYNQNALATLSAKVKLSLEKYLSKNLLLDDANLNFTVKDGVFNIKSDQLKFFGKNARGKAQWILSPFAEIPSYQIEYDVDKFYAEEMLATFLEDTMVTGPLNLSMSVNSKGTDWNSIVNNMKGNINLSGKDLIFYGLDADKVIDKFKRSQSFNLVDLGAVVLAGPVGLAVTKGTDFARILVTNAGESSQITNLVSHWELNNGVFIINDAAFTTNKNRIAAKGLIDFSQDSLNLTIALLNKYGCSVFSQNIYGNLDSPALGNVKVVGTILAPITNLVDDILGNDCVSFYNGSVNHPK